MKRGIKTWMEIEVEIEQCCICHCMEPQQNFMYFVKKNSQAHMTFILTQISTPELVKKCWKMNYKTIILKHDILKIPITDETRAGWSSTVHEKNNNTGLLPWWGPHAPHILYTHAHTHTHPSPSSKRKLSPFIYLYLELDWTFFFSFGVDNDCCSTNYVVPPNVSAVPWPRRLIR